MYVKMRSSQRKGKNKSRWIFAKILDVYKIKTFEYRPVTSHIDISYKRKAHFRFNFIKAQNAILFPDIVIDVFLFSNKNMWNITRGKRDVVEKTHHI